MRFLGKRCLYLSAVAVLCAAATVFADGTPVAVQLTLTSTPNNPTNTVDIYPYNLTITASDGSSQVNVPMVCDTDITSVEPFESWNANEFNLGSLIASPPTSGPTPLFWNESLNESGNFVSVQIQEGPNNNLYTQEQLYEQAAWLAQQIANPNNSADVPYIQNALWYIFNPTTNDNSNINVYAGSDGINWVSAAENNFNVTDPSQAYADVLVYAPNPATGGLTTGNPAGPITSTPGDQGLPQEFMEVVSTPEPSAAMLSGAGLLGLLALMFVFRSRAVGGTRNG